MRQKYTGTIPTASVCVCNIIWLFSTDPKPLNTNNVLDTFFWVSH